MTLHTADGHPLPGSLKLAFTNAANNHAVHAMFDPAIKSKIDPQDYVVKRETGIFEGQINNSHGTMLVDDAGVPFALTMAWHTAANDNKGNTYHRYTETGTTLTRLPGFHSAQAAVAALVLHQWWNHKPKGKIVAEILDENIPSQKLFRDAFQWKAITRAATAKDVLTRCNTNVLEDVNDDKPHKWYECKPHSIQAMAKSILAMQDRGTLNRKDGHKIQLDLSALNDVGLTRARLEAMAAGTLNRRTLRKITL